MQALAEAKGRRCGTRSRCGGSSSPSGSIAAAAQPGFRALEERFAHVSYEQLVAESVAFGSPDTVAARVEEFRRLGVGEMLCWMNFGGLAQDRVRRSMELFAREVIPRFR
jgi:alkanesulfonate monooxygenase SsuD/methylene tetrahydromethanopterin reductase-like flavin-dependent oxidoreductase (luciferase family)